ncbi:histidine kinase [Burkholderiaceae bacterium DAT-1]|nr:histidine kinase [Burkholderiaceae bacterium DAT-1]
MLHPLINDLRKAGWYAGLWTLAGGALAGLLRFLGFADKQGALNFALPLALVFGVVALSAWYVCRSFPHAQRAPARMIVAFTGSAAVSGLIWLGMCLAWNAAGASMGWPGGFVRMTAELETLLFALGAGLYMMSLLAHDALLAVSRLHEIARTEAEARVLARDAELKLLRTQIDPHFLFNSLNSISALTAIDPAGARAMAIDLAGFFRNTIALASEPLIPLSREIELCRQFAAIEQRRFGDKLNVTFDIDQAAEVALLPPMTLQPLLENAIKHGIRTLDVAGMVSIVARVQDGWLHLRVSNPVGEDAMPASGTGTGLNNIRERLKRSVGERFRLQAARKEAGWQVDITLPMEETT